MIRRTLLIVVLVFCVPVAIAASLGTAGGGGGSGYQVRAIFDDAAYIVPGEDVKVAGVKVGSVVSLGVTAAKRASVVLAVDSAGFTPFHTDAQCTIRQQSLIGEKFVDCNPGSDRAPTLSKIPKGRNGSGQHLLPVTNTSSPVDIDLVGDISRLPYRQRLAIIVNEFGTALAGRGQALNQAIHRANPALRQTDEVLAILAAQNRTLAQLARDSDTVIAPLAAKRQQVAHFIVSANQTAQATAEQSANIQASFQRLPGFLRQLQPTLRDLGALSDQFTPVLAGLHTAAPDLNRFFTDLGPFSQLATPATVTLGQAADVGRPALIAAQPTLTKLATFSKNAEPVGALLDQVTASLNQTGAIPQIMNYLFFQATAINGFDAVSHYLRAGLITNLCSSYATDPVSGCSANFAVNKTVRGAGAADSTLSRTEAALANGGTLPSGTAGTAQSSPVRPFSALQSLTDPKTAKQRQAAHALAQGSGGSTSIYGPASPDAVALDYLLGNNGR